jgi:hypothetical protein
LAKKASDKNLEQQINMKFCANIGITASGSLAVLALAYGEYAMKKLGFLNGIGGSRKVEKMCKMTQEVGNQKRKWQMQIWIEYEPWCIQIKD